MLGEFVIALVEGDVAQIVLGGNDPLGVLLLVGEVQAGGEGGCGGRVFPLVVMAHPYLGQCIAQAEGVWDGRVPFFRLAQPANRFGPLATAPPNAPQQEMGTRQHPRLASGQKLGEGGLHGRFGAI